MAATTISGGGAHQRPTSAVRTSALRFLTAALAGGAVLLLWGGTAGARAADEPSTAEGSGLVAGLAGPDGVLTPVIDLVDDVAGTTLGAAPASGTVATVDPVLAPVGQVVDPVLAPVVDTVGQVTTTISLPTSPTMPDAPVFPPVTDPTDLDPELPPLLPPDPTTPPGATPGSEAAPPAASRVVGSGVHLAGHAGHADGHGNGHRPAAARHAASTTTTATATAAGTHEGRHAAMATSGYHRGAGSDGTRERPAHRPATPAPAAPAPCTSSSSASPAGGTTAGYLAVRPGAHRPPSLPVDVPTDASALSALGVPPEAAPD